MAFKVLAENHDLVVKEIILGQTDTAVLIQVNVFQLLLSLDGCSRLAIPLQEVARLDRIEILRLVLFAQVLFEVGTNDGDLDSNQLYVSLISERLLTNALKANEKLITL